VFDIRNENKYITWNYTYFVIPYNHHHLRQLLFIDPVPARTTIFLVSGKVKYCRKHCGTNND